MSAADEGRSLGELVNSAIGELSGLVHDEIALAKAELRQDVRRAALGSVAVLIGAALLLLAMPLFSFGLAFWLRNWWDLPLALACVIVGGLYLLLGGLLFGFAKAKFGRLSPPERSIRSAKESAAVLSAVKPHPRGVPADKAGSAT
ncbi:phage holin family protein [Streptomyces avicenniae]|uniref:phage holin family protein n=1 Tax=Streptomyces avicenniae TaxID=500153 RepID=UPI00069B075B|nr:phage holin family protein [Streptomyces avicenniae]